MNVRSTLLAALVLVLATAPAACGVPAERTPRPITTGDTPPAVPAAEPTLSAGPGSPVELLYLVRDEKLVAVRRRAEHPPTPATQLAHLLAGPTDAEHDAGLTSALTGLEITARVRLNGAEAEVDLARRPDGAGRSDEVLAYGQIVCTLAARADVDTVSFRYDGQPVGVPRGDGSLAQQPLTEADYSALITAG